MRVAPIPRQLLVHTVEVNSVEYTKVRIDFTSNIGKQSNVEEINTTHVLYADRKYTPNYQQLENILLNGTIIKWQGKVYTVTGVDKTSALETQSHHLEVELS